MAKVVTIVGGGVVGLNIALVFAEACDAIDIFLFEREEYLGHHTSTRNSEVIHAGFAYPPGSLKARLCVEGNRLSYVLLEKLGVRFKRCGKWIVAFSAEEEKAIGSLMQNASVCNVPGMRRASPSEAVGAVPTLLSPRAAVFSESSGIIDAALYIKALEVALSRHSNIQIIYPCGVCSVDTLAKSIKTSRGDMNYDLFINAAGLFADDVYRMCGGSRQFEIRPFKGEYYIWRKGKIDGLVYPVPHSFLASGDATRVSSMGIHAHRSVAGDLFVGPSQLESSGYTRDEYSIRTGPGVFADAMKRMFLEAPLPNDLAPAFAGNRPKLFEGGKAIGDFEIFREGDIVHLLGIESPGLTAAPAIARYVCGMLED